MQVDRCVPVGKREIRSRAQARLLAVYVLGSQFVSGLSTVFDDHLGGLPTVSVDYLREDALGADYLYLLA